LVEENTMQIDFSEIADIEDLRAVPAGEYICQITEVRESQSPAGHTRWGMRWEVMTGEWQGRTACWDSLHWSERGLPRVKFVLQILGLESDGQIDVCPSALQGLRALVTVVPEEREDPVTGVRRLSNRVPYSGYAPA
jgi:uncharacterized protein DUF669